MVGIFASGLALGMALAHQATAGPILEKRDTTTSNVYFGNNTGTPRHLASGTLYGIPNDVNQIPSHFFTDIDWNYERSGGAQLPAPARGWIWGVSEYNVREFPS